MPCGGGGTDDYTSPDDVIDRALEVLHEQDEWLTANRQAINAKIGTGMAELERGEGIFPKMNWTPILQGW